ncbi:MAG: bifunctional helix-turn-helix transcriptional regulator/GNAT family N-acetyltransferase [Pseudomonadota bacterium]
MTIDLETRIPAIRSASRDLVRLWGFMGKGLAGTDLSASATHTLIEIGNEDGLTAGDVAARLCLDKSTVSRVIKSLVSRGEVSELPSDEDGRAKRLSLTEKGRATLAVVNDTAARQVRDALAKLSPEVQAMVERGLSEYASVLSRAPEAGAHTRARPKVVRGYVPGLIGRVAEISARHVLRRYPLGQEFECKVAREMSEFVPRASKSENGLWHVRSSDRIIGSITIDGENLGHGLAHLRWFMVAEDARGAGVGAALLDAALTHCDSYGFGETHLWTLRGLDAARCLYDRTGFELAEEYEGAQWGSPVIEQRFVRKRPT